MCGLPNVRLRLSLLGLSTSPSKQMYFYFHRTVHLDNVKIPFYQQMHLLLSI